MQPIGLKRQASVISRSSSYSTCSTNSSTTAKSRSENKRKRMLNIPFRNLKFPIRLITVERTLPNLAISLLAALCYKRILPFRRLGETVSSLKQRAKSEAKLLQTEFESYFPVGIKTFSLTKGRNFIEAVADYFKTKIIIFRPTVEKKKKDAEVVLKPTFLSIYKDEYEDRSIYLVLFRGYFGFLPKYRKNTVCEKCGRSFEHNQSLFKHRKICAGHQNYYTRHGRRITKTIERYALRAYKPIRPIWSEVESHLRGLMHVNASDFENNGNVVLDTETKSYDLDVERDFSGNANLKILESVVNVQQLFSISLATTVPKVPGFNKKQVAVFIEDPSHPKKFIQDSIVLLLKIAKKYRDDFAQQVLKYTNKLEHLYDHHNNNNNILKMRYINKTLEKIENLGKIPVIVHNLKFDYSILLRSDYFGELHKLSPITKIIRRNKQDIVRLETKDIKLFCSFQFIPKISLRNLLLESYAGDLKNQKIYCFPYGILKGENDAAFKALLMPVAKLTVDHFKDAMMPGKNFLLNLYTEYRALLAKGWNDERALKYLCIDQAPTDDLEEMLRRYKEFLKNNKCKSLGQLLTLYSENDVLPLTNVMAKLSHIIFSTLKYSMFTETISKASCALNAALYFPNDNRKIYSLENEELMQMALKSIMGGFCNSYDRLHECGTSKINPHKYGADAKTVNSIYTFDICASYPYSMQQDIFCTGTYRTMHPRDMWRKKIFADRNFAYLIIEWHRQKRKIPFRTEQGPFWEKSICCEVPHKRKPGEKVIKTYRVDGFFEGDKKKGRPTTIIEAYEIAGHGYCERHAAGRKIGEKMQKKQKADEERMENIKAVLPPDTEFIIEYECCVNERLNIGRTKEDREFQRFFAETRVDGLNNDTNYEELGTLAPQSIIQDILNGDLEGYAEVDLAVPPELREEWMSGLPIGPVFQHMSMTEAILDDRQKKIGKIHKQTFKPRQKVLVNKWSGRVFLHTQIIQQLVNNWQCTVSNPGLIFESKFSCPFREFMEKMDDLRLEAKLRDEILKVFILKCFQNCVYGSCIKDEGNRQNVKIMSDWLKIEWALKSPYFSSASPLGGDLNSVVPELYEISSEKHSFQRRLNPLLGVSILQHSKITLLAFLKAYILLYIPPEDVAIMGVDTDAWVLAFSGSTLEDTVPEEYRKHFLLYSKTRLAKYLEPNEVQTGYWSQSERYQAVAYLGPKFYACVFPDGSEKVTCKGVTASKNLDVTNFAALKKVIENPETYGPSLASAGSIITHTGVTVTTKAKKMTNFVWLCKHRYYDCLQCVKHLWD